MACRRACTSPAPVSRRPAALIASTCACERSKAQTSTSSSVARLAANSEPTAPQPTMQILMGQCLPEWAAGVPAGRRARGSENSRPPGDARRPQDQHRSHDDAEDDERRALRQIELEADVDAALGLAQERVQRAHDERAEHRAPEARGAAEDEHRERQERQLEVDRIGRDRAEDVHVEPAREAGERARERERPEPLAVHVDADRLGRRRVLARGAQHAPEAAALVGVGDADDDRARRSRAGAAPSDSGISESVVAPGPIFVHSRRMLCVISSTANVAMPAARPESRISGRPSTSASTPPTSAASTSEGTLPSVWSRRIGKSSGSTPDFDSTGIVITPDGEAADGDEADLPEREHARVADEDVDGDDHRDRDDRAQEVLLVGERDLRAEQPDEHDEHASGRAARARCAPRSYAIDHRGAPAHEQPGRAQQQHEDHERHHDRRQVDRCCPSAGRR